ncbi:hypothetical protein A7982_12790 [Minicystis rosea]|nr:hypothetical protein A7982_12790 [Minicystis rosea]
MSRYGHLACSECRTHLWLGKAVWTEDDKVSSFHRALGDCPSNAEQAALTRSLWKFLADHAGHPLRVLVEGEAGYEAIDDAWVEIGGDATNDVPFDRYLAGWKG